MTVWAHRKSVWLVTATESDNNDDFKYSIGQTLNSLIKDISFFLSFIALRIVTNSIQNPSRNGQIQSRIQALRGGSLGERVGCSKFAESFIERTVKA